MMLTRFSERRFGFLFLLVILAAPGPVHGGTAGCNGLVYCTDDFGPGYSTICRQGSGWATVYELFSCNADWTGTGGGRVTVSPNGWPPHDTITVRVWDAGHNEEIAGPAPPPFSAVVGPDAAVVEVNVSSTAASVTHTENFIFCLPPSRCCGSGCADTNPCTDNNCSRSTGICSIVNNSNPCGSDGIDCTRDNCFNGGCFEPRTASASCDDGDGCTTGDHCAGGSSTACVGGTPVVCNDSNPCTNDACYANQCHYDPNTASCDDGNVCTSASSCQGGQCVGTSNVNCDDWNPCTTDSCSPATGCTYGLHIDPVCPVSCTPQTCTFVSGSYPWAVCKPLVAPCGNNHPVAFYFQFWESGYIRTDASGGPLTKNGAESDLGTKWDIIHIASGPTSDSVYVAFRSKLTGMYWSADGGGGGTVRANATIVGANETFLLTLPSPYNIYSIRAANGGVVGVGWGHLVTADTPEHRQIGVACN